MHAHPNPAHPNRGRRLPAVLAVAVALALSAPSGAATAECWRPPVPSPVRDPYREPACPWCAGNRGIEYATAPGTPVRAVAAGTVSYAGVIAGTRYVVVEHADGRRATYGALASSPLTSGDRVVAGSLIGRSGARLHFGLRDGADYVDPTTDLGRLVHRTRLVPLDGSGAAPPGPPRLRCTRSSRSVGRAETRRGADSVSGRFATWRSGTHPSTNHSPSPPTAVAPAPGGRP